jgi:hypothetical protein
MAVSHIKAQGGNAVFHAKTELFNKRMGNQPRKGKGELVLVGAGPMAFFLYFQYLLKV